MGSGTLGHTDISTWILSGGKLAINAGQKSVAQLAESRGGTRKITPDGGKCKQSSQWQYKQVFDNSLWPEQASYRDPQENGRHAPYAENPSVDKPEWENQTDNDIQLAMIVSITKIRTALDLDTLNLAYTWPPPVVVIARSTWKLLEG